MVAIEAQHNRIDENTFLGVSPVSQKIRQTLTKLSTVHLPVFISGPPGVGKSFLAYLLHKTSSLANYPYIVKHAHQISFQSLNLITKGTLVIESVGVLSIKKQYELYRWLKTQAKNQEIRVVSIYRTDLVRKAAQGLFHQGLHNALTPFKIHVPPIRERVEDIEIFLKNYLHPYPVPLSSLQMLKSYDWPGNVREIYEVLEQLMSYSLESNYHLDEGLLKDILFQSAERYSWVPQKGQKTLSHVFEHFISQYFAAHSPGLPPEGLYDRLMAELETPLFDLTLRATGGNQAQAARILGIHRNTMRNKLKSK